MKSPGRRIALFALAVVACVGIVMGTSMPLVRAGESDGADDAHMALEALLAERCALDPDGKTGAGVTSAWCSMAARGSRCWTSEIKGFHFPSWSRRRSASAPQVTRKSPPNWSTRPRRSLSFPGRSLALFNVQCRSAPVDRLVSARRYAAGCGSHASGRQRTPGTLSRRLRSSPGGIVSLRLGDGRGTGPKARPWADAASRR